MKVRDVVTDDQGNYFAVTQVGDEFIEMRSVVTKEMFRVPMSEVTVVEGVVER